MTPKQIIEADETGRGMQDVRHGGQGFMVRGCSREPRRYRCGRPGGPTLEECYVYDRVKPRVR